MQLPRRRILHLLDQLVEWLTTLNILDRVVLTNFASLSSFFAQIGFTFFDQEFNCLGVVRGEVRKYVRILLHRLLFRLELLICLLLCMCWQDPASRFPVLLFSSFLHFLFFDNPASIDVFPSCIFVYHVLCNWNRLVDFVMISTFFLVSSKFPLLFLFFLLLQVLKYFVSSWRS